MEGFIRKKKVEKFLNLSPEKSQNLKHKIQFLSDSPFLSTPSHSDISNPMSKFLGCELESIKDVDACTKG